MHIPVLLNEVVSLMNIKKGDVFFDCTLGYGGHCLAILKKVSGVTYIGVDLDKDILKKAEERIKKEGLWEKNNIIFLVANFTDIENILKSLEIKKVDHILADLGWGSHTIDSGKGFSFEKDEKLLMMYGESGDVDFTAGDIINKWSEEAIANMIYSYGEERLSRRIARRIIEEREKKPIETTLELSEIIYRSYPKKYHKIHPATRTFQALRICVNNELENVKKIISTGLEYLSGGGDIAIISFHSLEDRIVKHSFRDLESEDLGKNISKKPIIATDEEIILNPRSRSAKLRIFRKK